MTDKLGPFILGPTDDVNQGVYTGDARELAKAIPDESIDLIFTDPIFSNIKDYSWLAKIAFRILKIGGSLITESGKFYLSEILSEMASSGLKWQTMLAEVFPHAWHRVYANKTMEGWTPYLWFSKGERNGPWVFDRFYAGGPDKRFHKWGDNPGIFLLYTAYLTVPESIILDPFAGGGTVPIVCKILGRRWLAFEIDPDTAEAARQRIRQIQPPLPGINVQQLELCEPELDKEHGIW